MIIKIKSMNKQSNLEVGKKRFGFIYIHIDTSTEVRKTHTEPLSFKV